jgi:hypothetical protein
MEKKTDIFDMSLDSLMSTPIEVEAVNDNAYPEDVFPRAKETTKAKEEPKKEEIPDDSIDLDEDIEEVEDEEDEDVEQEEPSSDKEPPQKQKQKTSSPLTPYAKLLVDEGVLPNLDVEKFGGSADELKDAMIEEIFNGIEMYKQTLPDRIKHLIDNHEEGVPFEKLLEWDRTETDISKIDEEKLEEDVSMQKKLVSDYLKKTTKFSDNKISKLVDGYEDSGDLEDEAKSALAELKTIVESDKAREKEAVTRQKKEAEENSKRELIALQDKVKNTKEIIPGIQLNDKMKSTIYTSMTTPVGYDQYGRPVNKIVAARSENPVEFEMKLHYLFEITKGFKDFTKLAEKGKKDASKSFEEAVKHLDENDVVDNGAEHVAKTKKGMDFLKGLEKTYKI